MVLTATIERFNAAAGWASMPTFSVAAPTFSGPTAMPRGMRNLPRCIANRAVLRDPALPGDIGAATGLRTDASGGFWISGTNPSSACTPVAMTYIHRSWAAPPRIRIGPGLTFAYLAAQDAVARSTAG